MKYTLVLLTAIVFQSCLPPSSNEVESRKQPDNSVMSEFGLKLKGKIIYQFYQSYGFTDKEEQLIMIVESNNLDFLTNDLPFDSAMIKKMELIDFRKFSKGRPINFEPEKLLHADIRIESWEYDSGETRDVYCDDGKYKLVRSESLETTIIFSQKTKLLYVESKKR